MTKTVYKYTLGMMHKVIPKTEKGLKILLDKNWKFSKKEAMKFYLENSNID